ncbi:MAG: DUF2911 domain-containing protein [Rubricoccaceae bacterium]|nr:DUF2911 domain-containing protein [Rubricoccaceae bacterium]
MAPRWTLLLVLLAPAASAQHDHAVGDEAETFLVEGLRVDTADPPPGSAVGRAGARLPDGGYLHVVYGKPYRRGRHIFGGLVGFDQVWATGAHRATELVVTVPATVGGAPVAPGVYSLFTTPRPDRWTLHLNTALGMHLADEYDPALDVVTVDLTPETLAEPVDAFTIDFVPADRGADLRIRWDRTAVAVPIRPR